MVSVLPYTLRGITEQFSGRLLSPREHRGGTGTDEIQLIELDEAEMFRATNCWTPSRNTTTEGRRRRPTWSPRQEPT